MKNNFFNICLIFFYILVINSHLHAYEQFNFDVTEVEIKEEGNLFIGRKRGIASTPDGLLIEADEFKYNKLLNILNANGKIKFKDTKKNIQIFADKLIYLKNTEEVFVEGNSKAINNDGIIITADKLEYEKFNNLIEAISNVEIIDTKKNYIINANHIKYFKNEEKILSIGKANAVIENKYNFKSSDVILYRNEMKLLSNKYSTLEDNNSNFYELENFKYFIDDEVLKGEDVIITTNVNKDKSDKFFFKNIFTTLKNKSFTASKTKILFHKNIFDKERKKFIDLENAKLNELFEDYYEENNPRLYGVSSSGDENKTTVNKGVFTSCKEKDKSPAWCLESERITHDKIKKQLIYKDTVLKIYDMPVFYFPKFFHPDPTVIRQSGFLKPELNESKTLGTSFYLPYFHVISESRDLTIKPTIFDSDIFMLQNEYRQKNKNSSFIADLGITKGYRSSIEGSNKNTMSHLFAKFESDLKIENYLKSDFEIYLEKTSNDTYLELFDANIPETRIKPNNKNRLSSGVKINLDHENYNLTSGMTIYETLSGTNSDRFQYVFPYYDYNKSLDVELDGSLNFSSNGSNTLQNTNNLKTKVSNNLTYSSKDFYSDFGFKNNFNLHFKNFNAIARNDDIYKSNLQSELMSIFEFGSSFPLIKEENNEFLNSITPKFSLRYNPTNMKNYSSENRNVNTDNIFSINRLGIGDSFEAGRSLTLGIDYRKENLNNIDKFFEFKLSTVLRDKFEKDIPVSSTLNRKNSNIFGSITNNFSENVKVDYNFALDNDLNTFEYNAINTEFSLNNFVTEFKFIEQGGLMGSVNSIENTTSIKFDNNNYFTFNTRRNRKTSLTEYYDLVYEYKNDCLTAGIHYKKSYYSDRDVKPNEDLMFTITLFPLTTLEQKVDQNLYRD